ncbi:hypothetical protein BN59_02303 [Legionella massiliensis]|uniref:Uncharacterized protein n=1 Tax=Legionella massiliensis TaxID=1034943 RepID=A0A078KYK3_9GAMM|nr:glycosyltransferase family 87 protein [Legionella massiliensis]CDZ78006.1 hypothetical protein BN59_02303 [Legionella massiliensis]CEE13744.1 hypothetical protein BN1094_02303 [Legionella massiliensis]
MSKTILGLFFSLIFIITYFLLTYFTVISPPIKDFTSFYAALVNLAENKTPYTQLVSSFLPTPQKLSPNLNPPIVLVLFSPLAKFSYYTALKIWVFLSFILGLFGAGLAFYYAIASNDLRKYWPVLYLFYLSLFSTMMNISTIQFGAFLLFFIMLGYHFYLTERHLTVGLCWGLIISFKFFPALLFFFVIKQGRLKVFFAMLATTIAACLIPYLLYGQSIYLQYMEMMSQVFWYGDNWNASIFGYIYRLFINIHNTKKHLIQLEIIYLILLFTALIWYLKKLGAQQSGQINHQPFCLTLTMMLLMSPFGWLYYFPLLIFPLVLTGITTEKSKRHFNSDILIWLVVLFFINAPQDYIMSRQLHGFPEKFFSASCPFYGLILFNYLCAKQQLLSGKNEINPPRNNRSSLAIASLILIIGMLTTSLRFIAHLH